jgi:hypothetical protein
MLVDATGTLAAATGSIVSLLPQGGCESDVVRTPDLGTSPGADAVPMYRVHTVERLALLEVVPNAREWASARETRSGDAQHPVDAPEVLGASFAPEQVSVEGTG